MHQEVMNIGRLNQEPGGIGLLNLPPKPRSAQFSQAIRKSGSKSKSTESIASNRDGRKSIFGLFRLDFNQAHFTKKVIRVLLLIAVIASVLFFIGDDSGASYSKAEQVPAIQETIEPQVQVFPTIQRNNSIIEQGDTIIEQNDNKMMAMIALLLAAVVVVILSIARRFNNFKETEKRQAK